MFVIMTRPAVAILMLGSLLFATSPSDATRRWWSYVTALAVDEMEGRNTGSAGYQRAARYVAKEFEGAGLQPAGENGSYFQPVPMHAVQLNSATSSVTLVRKSGARPLAWLHEITLTVAPGLPAQLNAGMIFLGTGPAPSNLDLTGKILVRLGAPVGAPPAERPLPTIPPGLLEKMSGTLTIDNLDGPERRRWPAAYAVNMALVGATAPPNPRPALFLNPAGSEPGRVARMLSDAMSEVSNFNSARRRRRTAAGFRPHLR
jgi:hypothetical protein